VHLPDILDAFRRVLQRAIAYAPHIISSEPLSVRERMVRIVHFLQKKMLMPFYHCFSQKEAPQGVAVSFVAILELAKSALLEIVQVADGVLHIKKKENR